jgi:ribosome-associated heat shock protein Hsp15
MTAPIDSVPGGSAAGRLDKWLWHARFFKSRSIAARVCIDGKVRVNGTRAVKAHAPVRPGDVLTFPAGARIRVIRIVALATRRGPAVEARLLYEDLDPAPMQKPVADVVAAPVAGREPGSGRPTKAERRAIDRLRGD